MARTAERSGQDSPAELHRIPVLDKAVQVLELLREHGGGLTINELVGRTGVARSTIYRILNTFSSHAIVARRPDGRYLLGVKIAALAAGISTEVSREDLVALCHDRLLALAEETGETCKVSVLNGTHAEVIDVAQSPSGLAPSSRAGSLFPLNAGAASKLLLAYQPADVLDRLLGQPLAALTPNTIVDRRSLERELGGIRAAGLSFDRGEWNVNVHAVAAPLFGFGGALVAALSATHFATGDEAEQRARVVAPLQHAAHALSEKLGHVPAAAPRQAKAA